MGANKCETVEVLLDAGVCVEFRTVTGGSPLTALSANEDSDPEVVRLVIENLKRSLSKEGCLARLNYQQKPTTFQWKSINFVAKSLYRLGFSKSSLVSFLALEAGTTPLNFAVRRGDVEIVKILLENGADPFIKNDVGMDAFDFCVQSGPFPSVMKILRK